MRDLLMILIAGFMGVNAQADKFEMITYNTWGFVLGSAKKIDERFAAIPSHLPAVDVLALQEVWKPVTSKRLIDALAKDYPYATPDHWVLGKFIESGVRIVSRWPIEEHYFQDYDACDGVDCLATKGVSYARINKEGVPYHIFATHTQAGNVDVALKQIAEIAQFKKAIGIPKGEAVLFAGDFNIARGTDYDAYQKLLRVLAVADYQATGHPFTADSLTNEWVNDGLRSILDYVLVSQDHKLPISATREIFIPQKNGMDLSDHYPVHATFEF